MSGAIANQVMWNRLISVVEEQAQALVRTAFSTSVREAGDLSAGVYDARGNMLAQAVTGTPGHVNAMAAAVAHFIEEVGRARIFEDDVYITNDPWKGTGHLHDVTVVSPAFHAGALIGFFACTAHVVDIGGRGFGADAASLFEEGLQIPIMKLAARGVVDRTLITLIRANVREPDQVAGDVYALQACNEVGKKRLGAMMAEFGLARLDELAAFILERSKSATLERIAALEEGVARGAMTIDGYDRPITIQTEVTIERDRVRCDFAGTSPIDPKGVNVPLVYTKAYACYALKCAIAPDIPNNAASLEPFAITAPEGSIVNAPRPAPVALRHIIGHMIPDAVYAALATLLPSKIPAEGAGCLCNFQLSLRAEDGRRAEVLTFNSGGSGARPTLDGMSATAFPSGVMTMPVEATEQAGPVVIWKKELRPDSGGAGARRGGLGQVMEVGARAGCAFDFQAMLDRIDHPARGRAGGRSGAPTTIARSDGAPMKGKGKHPTPEGVRVQLAFPGGGGYGAPERRARPALLRDVARGYVGVDDARALYGADDALIERALMAQRLGEDV